MNQFKTLRHVFSSHLVFFFFSSNLCHSGQTYRFRHCSLTVMGALEYPMTLPEMATNRNLKKERKYNSTIVTNWKLSIDDYKDNGITSLAMLGHSITSVDITNNLKRQTRETRHNHPLSYIPIIDTRNYIQYSFLPRTIEQWNRLPAAVAASPSLDAFKEGICSLTH